MTIENDTIATQPTAISRPPRARRAKAPTPAHEPAPATATATISKADGVIKLLLRAKGATPLELIAATDWQAHSVRAFLSGLRKKGRSIAHEARKNGEFAYRIVVTPAHVEQPESKPPTTTDGSAPRDTADA